MVLNDMPAVRLTNVTRRYGDLTAVDNLSLDIRKGEVLGLLGPNGSGKSTTMKMMLGPDTAELGHRERPGLRRGAGVASRSGAGWGTCPNRPASMSF